MSSLKRIVIHHTAGGYKPTEYERQFYHYLIGCPNGETALIYKGVYKPEDNINCNDGKYASHIKYFNTGSIGVACCGNAGYSILSRVNSTNYPLKQVQIEKMCSVIAHLCLTYDIIPSEDTVFTHYEYDQKNIKNKNIYSGKVDITYLPYLPNLQPKNVGTYLRCKVKWYYDKYKKGHDYEKKESFKTF